jgi:hypothetical protein
MHYRREQSRFIMHITSNGLLLNTGALELYREKHEGR